MAMLICVINAKPHNSADSLIGLQSGRSIFNYSPKKSEKIQNFHEDYSSPPAAMQRAILNYFPKKCAPGYVWKYRRCRRKLKPSFGANFVLNFIEGFQPKIGTG